MTRPPGGDTQEEEEDRKGYHPSWFLLLRDGLLVLCGLALLFNEAVILENPRESLLLVSLGMIGAPGFTIAKQLLGK